MHTVRRKASALNEKLVFRKKKENGGHKKCRQSCRHLRVKTEKINVLMTQSFPGSVRYIA